jgi:hypothetical protein
MTPEEALAKAKQVVGPVQETEWGSLRIEGDTEVAHGSLDDLLCEILKEHGYTELVEFFQKLDLWHS